MLLYNSGDTLVYGDTPIYFFNAKVTKSNFSKIKKQAFGFCIEFPLTDK